VSDFGPSFCTYSPSCREEVFSETERPLAFLADH
jgi:hypothetical protein